MRLSIRRYPFTILSILPILRYQRLESTRITNTSNTQANPVQIESPRRSQTTRKEGRRKNPSHPHPIPLHSIPPPPRPIRLIQHAPARALFPSLQRLPSTTPFCALHPHDVAPFPPLPPPLARVPHLPLLRHLLHLPFRPPQPAPLPRRANLGKTGLGRIEVPPGSSRLGQDGAR